MALLWRDLKCIFKLLKDSNRDRTPKQNGHFEIEIIKVNNSYMIIDVTLPYLKWLSMFYKNKMKDY